MKTTIYALVDPRDERLRYVGKTRVSVKTRFNNHLAAARAGVKRHSARWIRGVLQAGLEPSLFIVEVAEGDGTVEERHWIRVARLAGCPLTNLSDGGEGRSGFKLTPEQIEHRSSKIRGQKRSQEARDRMSAAQKGRGVHPNVVKARLGSKHTVEAKAKISAAGLGRQQTQATKDLRASKLLGSKRTEAQKLRISQAKKAAFEARRASGEELFKKSPWEDVDRVERGRQISGAKLRAFAARKEKDSPRD